jgi:predicted nucleic acid-binding protein
LGVVCNSTVLLTGTLTILLWAKQKGLISHLDTLLTQLKSAGFYTGEEYDEILKDAEES